MQDCYLLLGGNLGDRFFFMRRAAEEIEQAIGKIIAVSHLYETEPWGFEHAQDFLNQVVHLRTSLAPDELLRHTQQIEKRLGRIRKTVKKGYEGRKIDIDILYLGTHIVNRPDLHIPHLRLHERRFTLMPLAEIAPDFLHPIFRKNSCELLSLCEDNGKVLMLDKHAQCVNKS